MRELNSRYVKLFLLETMYLFIKQTFSIACLIKDIVFKSDNL